jgi:hypothetical protein
VVDDIDFNILPSLLEFLENPNEDIDVDVLNYVPQVIFDDFLEKF